MLVQQLNEAVGWCGVVLPRPKIFGQLIEGHGVFLEEVDVKHSRRLWQIVLFQIVVESSARSTEVGDSCRY